MDKKSNKKNYVNASSNVVGSKTNKKKNGKKAGQSSATQESMGIDWNLYEEMYAKTGFGKQFGKAGTKSSDRKGPMKVSIKRTVKGKDTDKKETSKVSSHRAELDKNTSKSSSKIEAKNTKYTSTNSSTKNNSGKKSTRKTNQDTNKSKPVVKTTASGEKICALYKKCGGCQYQGMDYAKQLEVKQKNAQTLLGKFGKVDQIIGMKDPYHYRNKVHAAFDRDRRGNYISGIYEEGTHDVVAVDNCMIQNKLANDIINSIRGLLKSFKIKTYDEDTGYGLLRRVLIRTGYHSGEVMVVLVLGSPVLPSKNNFVKALRKLHPEITTVVINVNDKQTSMILGDKETTIYGKGYIEDELCGLRFRISPKSFYQVNPIQTEVLYHTAIELAGLNGTQKIIDAYCGIGTIGMIASKHAKEVIGVELNSDAVRDARANAKLNGITNISFYNNDAGRFMVEMAEHNEQIDVVFMDPPRAGSDETFMDCVAKLAPKKVVYVSCNPETLARDLEYMNKVGYKVKKIIPVDMFPFTGHVETVVLLSR